MDDREAAIAAAKKRMAAFRLRQASSTATLPNVVPAAKSHALSHSRHNSTDLPLTASTAHNVSSIDDVLETPSVPSSPSPRSRPNSHHRRRSSVSTRRESAEMMGVPLPPEGSSESSNDPAELRTLALWALEGKGRPDNAFIGSFAKVEIPELNDSEIDDNLDALQASKTRTMHSGFGMGNSLIGKRDSFGKLLLPSSSSLKDQLHTLMEEEEEEEEENQKTKRNEQETTPIPTKSRDSVDSMSDKSNHRVESPQEDPHLQVVINRQRPSYLALRPLSLTPETLPMKRNDTLPTPSPTPPPRIGSGLRVLTLAPSPSPAPSYFPSSTSPLSSTFSRRQSTSVSLTPQYTEHVQNAMLSSDPSLNPMAPVPTRRSSISYKRTSSAELHKVYLPTPGPTPTSPLPPSLPSTFSPVPSALSLSSMDLDLDRPLSPTEQAFLFRSHTSLLCRISDLERAIADGGGRLPPGAGVPSSEFGVETRPSRSPSNERPASVSSIGSSSGSDPPDEMLQLVTDLKAERDELIRDAAGWRTRIADLERQIGTLNRRVEAERREGWVIRERLGVVEVEKKRVHEESEHVRLECLRLEKALKAEVEARSQADENRDVEVSRREAADREAQALRLEVARLRTRAEKAEAELQSLLATPKIGIPMQMPMPLVRRINSLGPGVSGNAMDMEDYVPLSLHNFQLKAVAEERDLPLDVTSEGDNGSEMDEGEEDELAHYEDEDGLDDDMIFSDDQTSSSFGSIARSNSHLTRLDLSAVAPVPVHGASVSHAKAGSMERGWSFPSQPGSARRTSPKVDRFFECLDSLDESDLEPDASLPTYDSATAKQFWREAAQAEDEDDGLPPFVLPAQPSTPQKRKRVKESEGAKLEVVAEEEGNSMLCESSDPAKNSTAKTPEPVTPSSSISSSTKMHKARRTSDELGKIPGFKPYSGTIPALKAPPPPKKSLSPSTKAPSTPANASAAPTSKPASPSQIPRPVGNSHSNSPSKPPASLPGVTFIPRLSTSPKTPQTSTSTKVPILTTPTTSPKASKTMTSATSSPFIPQQRLQSNTVTTRSSIPPPPSIEPRVLTKPAILQQNSAPRGQSLTSRLSHQMQSMTNFWSPWSSSSSMEEARSIGKEQQMARLRVRLQKEDAIDAPFTHCASCRDGSIEI